jgi:AbiV family abortive infection protein
MAKKWQRPKNYSTIRRMERQLFHNAHNLLTDACILYGSKSYPTAFALAVLAYEELGKLHLIDHIGYEAWASPDQREDQLDALFSNRLGFNHIVKQRWALCGTKLKPFSDVYHDGHLDRMKQACFYVGFRRGRITTPDRITARSAYNQITRVVKLSQKTRDIAFLDYDEKSTQHTRALASTYIAKAEEELATLTPPIRRGALNGRNNPLNGRGDVGHRGSVPTGRQLNKTTGNKSTQTQLN